MCTFSLQGENGNDQADNYHVCCKAYWRALWSTVLVGNCLRRLRCVDATRLVVDRVTLSNVISNQMNKNAKFPNLASEHWEPKEEGQNQAFDRSRGG
jgi:hypothetical protein